MNFLEFTFQSFWHFCGMIVLLSIAMTTIIGFAQAIFPPTNIHIDISEEVKNILDESKTKEDEPSADSSSD